MQNINSQPAQPLSLVEVTALITVINVGGVIAAGVLGNGMGLVVYGLIGGALIGAVAAVLFITSRRPAPARQPITDYEQVRPPTAKAESFVDPQEPGGGGIAGAVKNEW